MLYTMLMSKSCVFFLYLHYISNIFHRIVPSKWNRTENDFVRLLGTCWAVGTRLTQSGKYRRDNWYCTSYYNRERVSSTSWLIYFCFSFCWYLRKTAACSESVCLSGILKHKGVLKFNGRNRVVFLNVWCLVSKVLSGLGTEEQKQRKKRRFTF